MKILADENIPLITMRALRDMGHDVLDVRDSTTKGTADEILWDLAQKEKRLVITTDMGFARHRLSSHHGILIVRLKKPNRRKIHNQILRAMNDIKPESWPQTLVIMQDRIKRVWHGRTSH